MSTLNQKRLAVNLQEAVEKGKKVSLTELAVSSGYAPSTADGGVKDILEQKGTQEELEKRGFTAEKAKEVVASIMTNERVKPRDRLTAADMTFKVHGSYAPEKRVVQQTSVEGTPQDYVEATKLAQKYEQEYLDTLK